MNLENLTIQQLGDRKDLYESRIEDISRIVENRWAKLLGFGRQYFQDFKYRHPYVYVRVSTRYDDVFYDIIHNHYFVVDEKQALEDWKNSHKSTNKFYWRSTIFTPKQYLKDIEQITEYAFS